MIEAAETAIRFASARTRQDLDDDQMLRFALIRAIEVIGEAASRISEATRSSMSGIPWNLIVAMRNRLIHAYFDIDHDVLWRTVRHELPSLRTALQACVSER